MKESVSIARRVAELRQGFTPSFWVANFTEIFERVAYYGATAVLAIYLNEQLHFSIVLTGSLMSIFGFVVWFLPVLGGTLADRFGFRRALMAAYLILTVGYFLLGSLSASWMHPARAALGDKWLVLLILMVPALGPGVVKPCVAGTTARASTEDVRSLGYSIYYTMVNIGGALGPLMAFLVRKKLGLGIENVFRVAALCAFAMFWITLFFFREPAQPHEKKVASLWTAVKNIGIVLANLRFVLFLLIFSGFYVIFWQEWINLPLFIRKFINPAANTDLLLVVDSIVVISGTLLVTYFTRAIRPLPAMTLGFLIASLAWILLAVHPSIPFVVVALAVVALGEITQQPRYYEYVSRLAPSGQQGLYMGCAFLPIAIGYLIAGPFGAWLLHRYGEVLHRPAEMWWFVCAAGLVSTALMLAYDRLLKPPAAKDPAP